MVELFAALLSAPGREEITAKTVREIEASDLSGVVRFDHPPGKTARAHVISMLSTLAEASNGESLILILEDDLLVNRHIRHNVLTWQAPHNLRFGAGWLYRNGGLYNGGADLWSPNAEVDGGCATLWWGRTLRAAIPLLEEWFAAHEGPLGHDSGLAWAVYRMGLRICFHAPPLVEHRIDAPSLIGNPHTEWHTTRGSFRSDWRRP